MKTFLLRIMQGMMLVSLIATCLLVVGFFKEKKMGFALIKDEPVGVCGNVSSYSGSGSVDGKALFNANCAPCHKVDANLTGPALGGVESHYNKQELLARVRNSDSVLKSGNKRAVRLVKEYGLRCQQFPSLTDLEIESIFIYMRKWVPNSYPQVIGCR